MGYSFTGRVRFSESGDDGRLTLPGILDYFQDCCTFQVDSISQGHKELVKRKRVWVVSSLQIIVNRYPEQGEEIITTTYPYRLHGFTGLRNFTMDKADGERLAVANTQWTFLNLETGTPARLTEEDLRGYVLDEKLDMDYAPRKIIVPEGGRKADPFPVQKHHLDFNHHVNNCQYIRMAMDYLPQDYRAAQLRAEYRRQGLLDQIFCPLICQEEDRTVVALNNEEGEPYAVMEFLPVRKPE